MADALDADLYGDLYGNDEGDFNNDTQEPAPQAAEPEAEKPQAKAAEPQPAAVKPVESTPVPKATPYIPPPPPPSSFSVASAPVQSYEVPTTAPQPTSNSAYDPSAAQQIPTYEQPPASDYREQPQPQGDYQNIPVPERTVRPSEMKDEGKMFIGGLNWDTTDESLRNYFSQFGKVDACTIMRDAGGRSRCFAFLTFEEQASVNAVMVREHFLDGKIIDPKRAIPRQEHQRATKLFIGGLAGSVTSESMREFFSQFGKVIDSTVMLDRDTGRSKGFGFISFEDTNVQPFLGFGNLEIDGKLIDVKLAQPRYQRDGNEREGSQEYGGPPAPIPSAGRGAGNFGGPQAGFGGAVPGAPAAGNTPFDPQALAALYTRMFQMTGGAQMNPAMMGGGMGMMGPGGGYGGPGMGRGQMGGMGMGMGMGGPGMGMGGGGPGMGMGMGSPPPGMGGGPMGRGGALGGPAAMNPNIPRGPRGAPSGPGGGMGGHGVGPQRAGQRGQHSYHPYAR